MHEPNDDRDLAPTLRAARPEDEPFQRALFRARRAGPLRLAGVPERVVENLMATQFHARELGYEQAHPDARWLIVECAGEKAGELVLDVGAHRAHILDITLAPERQRRGVGPAVLRAVLQDIAPGRSVSALIDVANAPSRKMFARLGFVERAYDDVQVEAVWSG